MKISELLDYEGVIYLKEPLDTQKEVRIERDLNKLDSDSIYFCYKKPKDSNRYVIPRFPKSPPYAVVCDWDTTTEEASVPLIKVKNARRTLAYAYSTESRINYSQMKIIGITGTNGKTTTAQMIFRILREEGNKVGFIGTGIIRINESEISDTYYSMTTPDPHVLYPTLKKMEDAGCSYVVMEISSHSIALSKVAPITFECSVFTNLSPEHTDFHESMEEYYETKLSLFNQSKIGIFNLDDNYSRQAYEEAKCKKYSIGIVRRGDGYIIDFTSRGLSGSSYIYKDTERLFKTELKLAGAFNVYNALAATMCTLELGIRACTVKKALEGIEEIPGRLEVMDGEIKVVIDYAHTAIAFENLLKTLVSTKTSGQKMIIVFGCGGNRDLSKRSIMGRIAEKHADFLVLTEDNSRDENPDDIINDITKGIANEKVYIVIKDRREAIRYAIFRAKPGDIVAVVGKGHERYIIDSFGIHPFDERKIIEEALLERREKNESEA